MLSKNPAQRLRDNIDNIDAIQAFTLHMDYSAFVVDRKTVYAVVRALEIISEASRRLPADLKGDIREWTGSPLPLPGYLPARIRRRGRKSDLAHCPARFG